MLSRWMLAAGVALLVGVLLFWLHASGQVPLLQVLNIWALAGSPLLLWLLIFSARAYAYGGALSHHQFLEDEAQNAQESWQDWARRSVAVHACCALLPDQVSAAVLARGRTDLPPRTGQARRISVLPSAGDRTQASLQLLVTAVATALHALPATQELRVTLLNDAGAGQYDALRDAWQRIWASEKFNLQPTTITLTDQMSLQWIDDVLKTGSTAFELILVLQVNGKAAYSDGLAALLLCSDQLASACKLPVLADLLRPMPLDVTTLHSELPLLLQTQTSARLATGLLADGAHWQPTINEIFAIGRAHGAAVKVEQQWIQERLCGLTGPFSHWLIAALGVEMVLHQPQPLLLLAEEQSQHWINTVIKRELA
ncbi:hypothetical protein CES87_13030 [Pseudomonas sp. ERMR1:02]|nr:hypothetical protein CES87_13030 [Pseudomonas sp. ERMR1:02]